MTKIQYNFALWVVILVGLMISAMYAEHQVVNHDQLPMLERGYLLADHGRWTPYGNVSSGPFGSTPGYLSTALVGIPLMIWRTPYAPMGFLVVLMLLSYFVMDNVLKQYYEKYEHRIIWALIYWLNPWFLYQMVLWNPSYLFLCTALHLWSAQGMRTRRSFWLTFIHVIAIGCALQMHFSTLVLILCSLALFLTKMIRVSWLGFFAGSTIVLLSLIPYLSTLIFSPEVINVHGHIHGNLVVEARAWWQQLIQIAKAGLYWLRYASLLFTNKLIFFSEFGFLSNYETIQAITKISYKTILVLAGIITLWISIKANYRIAVLAKPWFKNRNWREREHAIPWLWMYVCMIGVSVIISAAVSPILFSYWHLLIVFPIALIPILHWLVTRIGNNSSRAKLTIVSLFAYFCVVNFIGANDSNKFKAELSFADSVAGVTHVVQITMEPDIQQ